MLTRFAACSLVVADVTGGKNGTEPARYRLLETVRQYAHQRLLERGDASWVHARHVAHYLELAETAQQGLRGSEQTRCLLELQAERGNLRAALGWTLAAAQGETAMRLAGSLSQFWIARGHLAEGQHWLERALAAASGEERTAVRARALNAAGCLAAARGDYPTAKTLFLEAAVLRRTVDDFGGAGDSLSNVGILEWMMGHNGAAQELIEESLGLRRTAGDRWGIAHSLGTLGCLARERGEYARAETHLGEALRLRRELKDTAGEADSLADLAVVAKAQDAPDRARLYFEESLAGWRRLDHQIGIANTLCNMGILEHEQGRHTEARDLCEQALAVGRETGSPKLIADALVRLGRIALTQGDPREAESLSRESLSLRQGLVDQGEITECLRVLVATWLGQRLLARAGRLLGALLALQGAPGCARWPPGGLDDAAFTSVLDVVVADDALLNACGLPLEQAVEREALEVAVTEGRLLRLERAVEEALQTGTGPLSR